MFLTIVSRQDLHLFICNLFCSDNIPKRCPYHKRKGRRRKGVRDKVLVTEIVTEVVVQE